MLSLVDTLARLGSGAVTAAENVAEVLRGIEAGEPDVRAFAHVNRRAVAGTAGPLAGVSVAVKDIIDTADMPTAMGSPIYAGWRPFADAAVVAAFRRAGATIIGKTTTTPFAFSDPTETRNPRNLAHTPGGSSAGSAAAVAAGMVPIAVGTQTGGSVIRPASFCGVAAIKPSFRLIPTVGMKCFSWTLDTVGLFAAGVPDLAAALEIVTGRRMARQRPAPRIGILRQDFAGAAEPDGEAALERASSLFSGAGAELAEVAPPPSLGEGWAAHATIQNFEARTALGFEYDNHRGDLPPKLRAGLDGGSTISAEAYDDARRVANRARRDAKELFRNVDALITYSAPGPAPEGYDSTGEPRFNQVWTLLGTPCVNVPGLVAANGLPIGIQVVAPFAHDDLALAVAALLERALAKAG